jgi:hypothetical protein
MLTGKNLMIIGFVVVVFVILQGLLISVGKVDSPVEAAVDFTKAYFMLDGASMSQLLCREIVEDEEVDIVDAYLNSVAVQARSMGFSQSYMRNQLSHISTEIQMTDENKAKVESHKVDETLTLVKEDDKWKVCGKPFSLSEI